MKPKHDTVTAEIAWLRRPYRDMSLANREHALRWSKKILLNMVQPGTRLLLSQGRVHGSVRYYYFFYEDSGELGDRFNQEPLD